MTTEEPQNTADFKQTPDVSIIVPIYNEETNITQTATEVRDAFNDTNKTFELLFVDDCSNDGTRNLLNTLLTDMPHITPIHLPERSGQSAAMLAGMQAAKGNIIITMDGDCQNNPADIPTLLTELATVDVVCGFRADRKDSWSRRTGSKWANRVRNRVTHDGMRDSGCSLKAFKRCCMLDLPRLDGVHRFMPAYFVLNKRRIKEVPVDHRARTSGTSKYTNMGRLPRTILDLIGFWWYRRRYLAPR